MNLEPTLNRLGTVSAVSTQRPASSEDGSYSFFDGHVSLDEEFVHTLLEPSTAQVTGLVDAVLSGRMPDGRVFITARINPHGAGRVVMDPNGQYRSTCSGGTGISSSRTASISWRPRFVPRG